MPILQDELNVPFFKDLTDKQKKQIIELSLLSDERVRKETTNAASLSIASKLMEKSTQSLSNMLEEVGLKITKSDEN